MADAPLATFSPCGRYRYTLRRTCGGLLLTEADGFAGDGQVVWIMLNPSTADASVDDPTIRKVRGYSERWGYRSLVVVNAYAWRSTDPRVLPSIADPVGPDNDAAIVSACAGAAQAGGPGVGLVVCAWGKNLRPNRLAELARLLAGVPLHALKLNGDGSPAHPLYLANVLMPQPFALEAHV